MKQPSPGIRSVTAEAAVSRAQRPPISLVESGATSNYEFNF